MSTVSQRLVGAWTRYVHLPHTCPTAS